MDVNDYIQALQDKADEAEGFHRHTELHAAADCLRLGFSSEYVDLWIEGLITQLNIS